MKAPGVKAVYTQDDLDVLGFHDCRLCSIAWKDMAFALELDIEYIVQWVKPAHDEGNYSFWISPAKLRFSDVDDADIILSWHGVMLDCIIDDLVRGETRSTPNGISQFRWNLRLSAPSGSITLWATDFELTILSPPVLCAVQRLEAGSNA